MPEIRKADLTSPWKDSVKTTFKYTKPTDDINLHNLHNLSNVMFEHINLYLQALDLNQACKINLLDSWFNFNGRGAYQSAHHHLPSSTLSAVYYHQTNEQDGNIRFNSPCAAQSMFPLWQHVNVFHVKDSAEYAPKVGKLLIFPSYLLHSVHENQTDHERISISCNFVVTPHNENI